MNENIKKSIVIDGILCFDIDVSDEHSDYSASGLETLYKNEQFHFWCITRQERIIDLFKKHVPIEAKILEIGAGTGNITRGLMKEGYTPEVGELHLLGLRYAKSYGIEKCYQFNLFKPPFYNKYDVVGMFDVLEHLKNSVLALQKVKQMLHVGGKIILSVPAHQWLWSRSDKVAGHKRRYSKQTLINELQEAGFKVLEVRYFFVTIVPLLWFRHKFDSDNEIDVNEMERTNFLRINKPLNLLLLVLTRLENKLKKFIPNLVGGSLYIVAIKDGE